MTVRSELLASLAELSRRYPDWRLGQLVSNVAGWADTDLWEIDDEKMLVAAKVALEETLDVRNKHVGT